MYSIFPILKYSIIFKGSSSSGNFGHAGRPGLVGGSSDGGNVSVDQVQSKLNSMEKLDRNGMSSSTGSYINILDHQVLDDSSIEKIEGNVSGKTLSTLPIKSFAIKGTYFIQPVVERSKIERGLDLKWKNQPSWEKPLFIQYQGKTILWDGSHRVISAELMGVSSIEGRFLKI